MTTLPSALRSLHDQRGISIVELLVYVALGAMITAVLTGIIISGFTAETNNRNLDIATGEALVVQEVLQTQLRNAESSTVAIIDSGAGVSACVALGAGNWETRSWRINEQGELVTETGGVLASGIRTGDDPAFQISAGSPAVLSYHFDITRPGIAVPVTGRVLVHAELNANPCS